MLENLKKYKLVLGSTSSRRQELLKRLHLSFSVKKPLAEENNTAHLPANKVPEYLARLKSKSLVPDISDNDILLTADTVVLLDDEILGKPSTREEAVQILQKLSGKTHRVITAVQIYHRSQEHLIKDTTVVHFEVLSDEEIDFYVDCYKPYDKAGAYGIQEWISLIGVKEICGSYYNVMGLPVHKIYRVLKSLK